MTEALAVGSAVQALSALQRQVGQLFTNLLGPASEEIGLSLGLGVAYYRLKILLSIGEKTERLLKGRKLPKDHNLGRIVPILEAASIENDDDLQNRWAALLANAIIYANGAKPSFAEVLKQLTAHDARFLDKIFDNMQFAGRKKQRRYTEQDFYEIYFGNELVLSSNEVQDRSEFIAASLDNFERLGLLRHHDVLIRNTRDRFIQVYSLTAFAATFVNACRDTKHDNVPNSFTSSEFVIGGYLPSGRNISLLIGFDEKILNTLPSAVQKVWRGEFKKYGKGAIIYLSAIGGNFKPLLKNEMFGEIRALRTKKCPFANLPISHAGSRGFKPATMAKSIWLKPELRCHIWFQEWTSSGHLLNAKFRHLVLTHFGSGCL